MDPCGPKWHQRATSNGNTTWFWLGTRLRNEEGTYIYRVGPVPDDAFCSTIWCYGDRGVAWTCSACGEEIGSERYQPPSDPRA